MYNTSKVTRKTNLARECFEEECSILCLMLRSQTQLELGLDMLNQRYFENPENKFILEMMKKLYVEHRDINISDLLLLIKNAKVPKSIQNMKIENHVHKICDLDPTHKTIFFYIDVIRFKTMLDQLIGIKSASKPESVPCYDVMYGLLDKLVNDPL